MQENNNEKSTEKSGKLTVSKLKSLKKLNIKKLLLVLFLVLLGVGGYFLYKNYFIAATVNGEQITRLEVLKTLEEQGGESVLENLIVQKLIKQEAARRNVNVTDEQIQAEIQQIEAQYATQGLTLQDILSYQNMTRENLEQFIEQQMMLEGLVGSSFIVTDEELNQYIEQNEASFPEVTDEVREHVRGQLSSQKQQAEFEKYLQQKRQEARVEYFYYEGSAATQL